jgi:hypothetical protein
MFPAILFIFLIFVLFFYNNRNLEKPIEKVLEEDKDNRENFLCKNFIDNNQKYTTIDFFNNLKLEVKGKPCAFSDLQPIEKSLFKINLYEKIEKELHELLVEESIKNENKEILKNFYFKIKKSIYQEIDLIYDNYSGSISKIDKMFLESKK